MGGVAAESQGDEAGGSKNDVAGDKICALGWEFIDISRWIHEAFTEQGNAACVMGNESQQSRVRSFKLTDVNKSKVMKYVTVVAMAAGGVGLMMGGCLAWVFGERFLLLTAFLSGSVFVAAGAMGFLKCLDDAR